MCQPPATSSSSLSSSSSATATPFAHQYCPSSRWGLSSSKFDNHSICFDCRPFDCDFSSRCFEYYYLVSFRDRGLPSATAFLDSECKRAKTVDSALPSISPALVTSASDSQTRSDVVYVRFSLGCRQLLNLSLPIFLISLGVLVRAPLVSMCMLLILLFQLQQLCQV